ncbi:hypothetical protein M6D81_19180 [Paenibacillus sp. J5C_2022]|uniref:hypothetical protein n=1 Tax=Paenibacillus sp. J5C2022 TaxID=2977129 RepID=UPI0021D2A34C|nr:hypothetical protein [Paenibacillus sp. J5C2022]MCU6710820.1 hypothetical protein [Paenibacillus sp. J5C2022]
MNELVSLYVTVAAVAIMLLAFQVYFTVIVYRREQSLGWACAALFLFTGLNVLLYQAIKLEKRAELRPEEMTDEERKVWRRVYLLLIVQYMVLFAALSWIF